MQTMNCILTGKEVNYNRYESHYNYTLEVAGNEVEIYICSTCKYNIKTFEHTYIIEGLIANKKWPKLTEIALENCTN